MAKNKWIGLSYEDNEICKTCKYRVRLSQRSHCGYLLITGKRRGCKSTSTWCDKYEEGTALTTLNDKEEWEDVDIYDE